MDRASVQTAAAESSLVLQLRPGPRTGRTCLPHAGRARRVHAPLPGIARRLRSDDVLQGLTDLFVTHGPPEHIRADTGPELIAINVREWLGRIGVKTLYIALGERLLREPELKAQRRAAKRRDLHDAARGASADRELETALQCHPAALKWKVLCCGLTKRASPVEGCSLPLA